MSEKQNRGISDLSKYDAMTTEELEEILRLDAQAPQEQESDIEKILYIMEVLTERNRNNVHTRKTALEAYESFKQNYMPESTDSDIPRIDTGKVKRRFPQWLHRLTAAAAVLIILIFGSITAKAFGINVWEAVVKWTQETFHFGEWGDSNIDDSSNYTSLQEALEQRKINTRLAPNWFPDGYELVYIKVDHSPLQIAYKAIYAKGAQELRITLQDYIDEDPIFFEQSEGLVEEYETSGIIYYLFENNKRTQAVWIVDSFECHILGDLTIDELKLMIDSIEKG